MSRLIVKNLPKNVTDDKLKDLFGQKGLVTDVQLKFTKDGKFRRFGFIGFKTEDQALNAQKYFNKTCINTCRISVEQCASLGDPSKPRSWSKYAADSSQVAANNKTKTGKAENLNEKTTVVSKKEQKSKEEDESKKTDRESNEIEKALEKHNDDPLFMEFIESHNASGLKAVWGNDVGISDTNNKKNSIDHVHMENKKSDDKQNEGDKEEKQKIADKVISDLEYMEALKKNQKKLEDKIDVEKKTPGHGTTKFFTVKLRGLAYNHKKKDVKLFFQPLKAKSIRVPQKIKGIAYVGFKTEQHLRKALLKNKSFLGGKQIFVAKYDERNDVKASEAKDENTANIRWKKQEEALKDEESIAESGRLFIRNLSYTTTENDIRELFEKYGPLTEVNLPVDKVTRKQKGFGTVTFMMTQHAVKAYSELDGSILNGRMLHLLPGKAKPDPIEQVDENLTYKQKKQLQTKATAGSLHNWNTLFLGQNAVAEAVAAIYNTTKEKVLEDSSKGMSAAVKLALGETQLVQDTKNFLEENDVCLDAFNQPSKKRSRTVILVKNLPAATQLQEIGQMFAQFGEIGRVVMPPSGISALIEFLEPSEARIAFTKLAYTKYKNLPLYLEWAPDNSFTTPPPEKCKNVETKAAADVKVKKEETVKGINGHKKEDNEDEEEPEADTTLFVKNINFTTTEEKLKTYFSKCGPIHYATIATKKDPKNSGAKLSMGYGFVRYKRKFDADRALKILQMTVLDEKTLELKRSERTLTTDITTIRKTSNTTEQTGTKILIRNVPFQANIQELTELFKAFGELKAVRLPKQFTGAEKHRGFAFVEYYTKCEAKKAFQTLCQSTHLYGRRLVLEWAQTEEGVEEIRKRTAKHFHQEGQPIKSKKSTVNPADVGLEVN